MAILIEGKEEVPALFSSLLFSSLAWDMSVGHFFVSAA